MKQSALIMESVSEHHAKKSGLNALALRKLACILENKALKQYVGQTGRKESAAKKMSYVLLQ